MATKKTTPKTAEPKKTTRKAAPKKQPKSTVIYKEQEYEVLDRMDNKIMLTDGLIHFWVRAEEVKEGE